VAVNPLGGLVDRPFEQAVATARPVLGIRGLPALDELRQAEAEGRVTEADVRAAVRRRHPALGEDDAAALASRVLAAEDADLAVPPRTVAERCDAALGTRVAAAVDAEAAKWCAAFADEDAHGWRMPGRERGFYVAWKELAGRGPALRRLARPGVRDRLAALPDDPEDALLQALDALEVPAARRVDELQGHLGRQPGWASLAAWHEDQAIHGLDLVQLLAVRVTYEAELVSAAAGRAFGGGAPLRRLLEQLGDAGPAPARPEDAEALELGAIALAAREGAYADRLLADLDRPAARAAARGGRRRRPCSASTPARRGCAAGSSAGGRTRPTASPASSGWRCRSARSARAAPTPRRPCCSTRPTRSPRSPRGGRRPLPARQDRAGRRRARLRQRQGGRRVAVRPGRARRPGRRSAGGGQDGRRRRPRAAAGAAAGGRRARAATSSTSTPR
jgi:hypothetical protein